jgi:hypothetical protein
VKATQFLGVSKDTSRSPEDVISTPLPGETLAVFYARSRESVQLFGSGTFGLIFLWGAQVIIGLKKRSEPVTIEGNFFEGTGSLLQKSGIVRFLSLGLWLM